MKASAGGRVLDAEPPGGCEPRWMPLNALRAFEAVGRRLSFTQAAAALRVSQSSLSRHVSRLEELLGRRLLERRPAGLVLTEAGAALLPVVQASFDRIQDAMRALSVEAGGSVDVSSSNGTGLPAAHEADVAVVYDRPGGSEAVRDLLWMVREIPACAPALARRATGMDLAGFLRATVLLHVKHPGEPPGLLWDAYASHQGITLPPARSLAFETAVLAIECALDGGGVALVDPDMFARELAEGLLVTPFPAVRESGFGYYLAVHPEDVTDPAVAALRTWVVQRLTRSGAGIS